MVAAYISKGVTTLPHNYHAGWLRHNATKLRACNLDTPPKFHRDNSPWLKADAPPQNGTQPRSHYITISIFSVNAIFFTLTPNIPILFQPFHNISSDSFIAVGIQGFLHPFTYISGEMYCHAVMIHTD